MNKNNKPSGDQSVLSPMLFVVASLAIAAIAHNLWLRACAFWIAHPYLIVCSGISISGSLIFLGYAKFKNWSAGKAHDKSITEKDPTSVHLGTDKHHKDVYLKEKYRTMHAQVIGTTFSGKTESVILPMAIHDIENGSGTLIVDGKADTSFLDKIWAYVVKAGREKDFRLFSLAHIDRSHTFNPLVGGSAAEVVERVFNSFNFENEYYRNIQYKIFLLLIRLILERKQVPTFALAHRLLTDVTLLQNWTLESKDRALQYELHKFIKESPKDRAEKTSGLETNLSHFATGEFATLFNDEKPHIDFEKALSKNLICYFQLPSMYLPFLSSATGKLVLQSFQSAVSKRHTGVAGKKAFFSCFLDDFQDYIYEGFGALLNKSRSANIGVVFSHQALGDLEKVSPEFANVVLTNTNIKCIMRSNDPKSAEFFSKSFGTKKSEKLTERQSTNALGASRTGDGSVREVDEFIIHPNEIKDQPLGHGIVSIPHERGVKVLKLAFKMRKDLPKVRLPLVLKAMPVLPALPIESESTAKTSTEKAPPSATDAHGDHV